MRYEAGAGSNTEGMEPHRFWAFCTSEQGGIWKRMQVVSELLLVTVTGYKKRKALLALTYYLVVLGTMYNVRLG